MDPGDVGPAVVDARALRPEVSDAAGNVLGLEAHEVHALAVPREELAHRLGGIGRLQQLDVADTGGQDRVLEAELGRFTASVHGEAEELRVPIDGRLEV